MQILKVSHLQCYGMNVDRKSLVMQRQPISGDKQLCETYASLHPKLVTTAVKEGNAFAAVCMSPTQAIATIEKDVTGALA